MLERFCAVVAACAGLAASASGQLYEFTIDSAGTSLVMEGDVFQQRFNCSNGTPIDPSPIPLGPIQLCPSGATQIPIALSGTLEMVVRRDPRSGVFVARFAGGDVTTADFQGFVGDCGAPDAQVDVTGFQFLLTSGFFAIHAPGVPVAGCFPNDDFGGTVRMRALGGEATITPSPGDPVLLECNSSESEPMCGRLERRTIEIRFGGVDPLSFPFRYVVDDFCPFVPRVDFTGEFRFSGTLRLRMTRVLTGPVRDPSPSCP